MKIKINYRRFFQVIFASIAIFSLLIVGIFSCIYFINPNLFESTIKSIAPIINPMAVSEKPINVLLMGIDQISENTDVMLVAHVEPEKKKVAVISVPRDTMVYYSSGKAFKINSAYKQKLSKEKLNDILGITIDYQVAADTKGFRNIIDILEGVTVDVPMNMDYDDYEQNLHIHLKKGVQLLDGNKAEQFVRFRYGNKGGGDIDRINTQHIFFKALVEQKLTPKYILKIDNIIREVLDNVKTEMSYTDIMRYALFAKNLKSEDIVFYTLPGESKTVDGLSYFIHDKTKTAEMMQEILQ